MDTNPFTPPEFKKKCFNCPFCNAFAHQDWYYAYHETHQFHNKELFKVINKIVYRDDVTPPPYNISEVMVAFCSHCKNYSLWNEGKMVYPDVSAIPMPNPDLKPEIKTDYMEARSIVNKSPRGAAALLRLCVQKLCRQLGESGKNIDNDIANLVKKGLYVQIQQALDVVRVIGNNAVHPGQIDLKDDIKTASSLFDLVNTIAQLTVSQPKKIKKLYENLPKTSRNAIKKRDKTSP